MNFTTSELLLLIIIVSIILIIFVVLTIMDIKDYLRSKNKTVVLKEEDNEIELDEEKEEQVQTYEVNKKNVEIIKANDKPLIEESEIIFGEEDYDPFYEEEDVIVPVKDEIIYKDAINEKEAKEEFAKVNNYIQEEKEDLTDTITNFEMEQEENAIISLDELMKVSDRLYEDNEPTQYDEGNEPITIDEVINRYNDIKNNADEVSVVKASDAIRDADKEVYIEEEEDFLTDLELAHNNLRR